jgi:two-component system sensor histidine kinase KdpD
MIVGLLGLVTAVCWYMPFSYLALGYIYLLAVIALSTRVSRWPALVSAILSSLAWNFFFVPPRLSFSVLHLDESLLLVTYFVVALIGSQLTALRAAVDRARLLAASEHMHQTLLDSVAHELKTPIAVFRSAVEQLDTDDPVKRRILMAELRIAVQRLDSLVVNLLNQTRLESGMLRPKLDWCDGRELVAAARRDVGTRLEVHPFSIEIPADLPIFMADAALMEQAIAHLLLNAAVHTPPEGRVRVSAGMSEDGKRVLFTVQDDGPGISAEFRETIFDKFSRGPNARMGGLGLGLSIVRGFMRAQGGDVTVDSPSGGGARFTLSLPSAKIETVPLG